MSSPAVPGSPISTTTTDSFSPVQSSILPYTQGLSGVNLWLNSITSDALYASLGLIVIIILLVRIAQVLSRHIRLLTTLSLNAEQQQYWKSNSGRFWSKIKKSLLVAPLIHKRHNKEIQLSNAVNVGTLPSRLHTLFLLFYLLTNVMYCCILDYHNQPRAALLAEARGRTGHLAVMNMLPLFLFSARNNPFVPLLGISFDTFNLFHRWIGRVVVIESIAHTFIWGVNNYDARGLNGLTTHLRGDPFLVYGLISTVAMTAILFQSVSFVRHAFYESFLHFHQVLAVAVMAGIVLHCQSQQLPQAPYIYTLISLWGLERLIRLGRILYRRGTTVEVEALEGGACRVTFNLRGGWTRAPGCHIYAYIPSISLWMSHPFSVAWVDRSPIETENEKWNHTLSNSQTLTPSATPSLEVDFTPLPKSTRMQISCVIASRTGMTSSLYRKAMRSPSRTLYLKAMIEGPYGGLENMRSYGTVLLFAGGVGITHQLGHVRDLVEGFQGGREATRKVVLIWSVRTLLQTRWVGGWLDELSRLPRRECELKILIYVTRGCLGESSSEAESQSQDGLAKEMQIEGKEVDKVERVEFGRMNVRELVRREFEERVGAMCIGVCGPGGLADDVRAASRGVMGEGNVDFWEESFTW